MSAAALIEAALKSLVCAGATLTALRLLARRSAAERSWIAHIGLLATLAAPFAGELLPRWYVAPVSLTAAATPLPATAAEPTVAAAAIDPEPLLLAGWAVPALLLLLATVVAVGRLFALRRRATVLTDQPWLSALAHAQRRMGFKNGAALLVSPDFASPVSWGVVRPTIVINETALAADIDAEAIIAHELAHVARLDWIKLLVARAATALFWFNPLVWALARACHQLREEAADDAVLLSDVRDIHYAALLVGAARHEQNGFLLAANGVAPGRSSLGRRVARVLDGTAWRAPATVGWSLACVGAGLLLAGPLGMMTLAPPVAQLRSATATRPALSATTPATMPVQAIRAPALPPSTPAAGKAYAAPIRPIAPVPATDVADTPDTPDVPDLPQRIDAATARASSAAARAVAAVFPPTPPAPPGLPRASLAMLADGITSADLAGWRAISPGYGSFSTGQIVGLRANGVTTAWLREMAALGYRDLPFNRILMMAAQGVSPRFVREMAAAGYSQLTTEQLIAMRIHGVSPRLVERLRQRGVAHPSAQELIDYAIVGVEPDHPPGTAPGFPFQN